jgi:hypothetical protein
VAISELTLREARRSKAGSYTPSEDEKEGLRALESRWHPFEPLRLSYERQWSINLAFLIGMQYVRWDTATRQVLYQQTPSLRWRARAVHNFCRPYVENEVASSGAFNPTFKVRPKNADPENFNKAESNQDVLLHYWDKLGMRSKRYDLLYLVKSMGTGWLYSGWDREGGTAITSDPETVMVRGSPTQVAHTEYEGEIDSYPVSPFHIYYDLAASRPEDLRWLIHARAVPIEWVEQHYPDKCDFIPLGLEREIIQRQRWVVDLAGPTGALSMQAPSETRKDWVLVRELYEMPSLDFPNGRYLVDGNGVLLEAPKDNPTPGGKLPFTLFRDMLVPGRIAGQCNLDNLIEMQRSYNRKVSKKEEHIVLTANAKILFHAQTDVPNSAFSTEVGEIIPWHGQAPPAYLVPPSMPPETDTELNRDRGDMDFITRAFGPGRGQYPGKVSGKMVSHLIEQEDRNKAPMVDRLSEGLCEWGTRILQLAQKYVIEPRLIHVIGRNKQFSAKEFIGQDVDGNYECSIEVESMFPKSRTMAMELIVPLTQLGWLSPMNKQDRARVFKSLSMEDDAPLVEDAMLDMRCARNENRLLMMGQMVPKAEYWEDQDIHMLIHAECAKSDEFKKSHPIIQDMLRSHMQTHIDLAQPRAGVTVPTEESSAEPAPQIDAGAPPQAQMAQGPQMSMSAYT